MSATPLQLPPVPNGESVRPIFLVPQKPRKLARNFVPRHAGLEALEVLPSSEQQQFAELVGIRRRLRARAKGVVDQLVTEQDPWRVETLGALTELACAKALGLEWLDPVFDMPACPDLGGAVEVRYTTRPDGCLLLQKTDPPQAPFVLVVVRNPICLLAGWVYGREGMRQDFWWEAGYDRPCYYVPQGYLRPMRSLLHLVRRGKAAELGL